MFRVCKSHRTHDIEPALSRSDIAVRIRITSPAALGFVLPERHVPSALVRTDKEESLPRTGHGHVEESEFLALHVESHTFPYNLLIKCLRFDLSFGVDRHGPDPEV